MVNTKTIEQTVTIKASPHEVYEALMDSVKHSQFTGAPANISREIGGSFTAYGGALSGTIAAGLQDCPVLARVRRWMGSWVLL